MIKPVLIPTDKSNLVLNTTNDRLILGVGSVLPITGKCYDISFIDTEAKIIEGSLVYCELNYTHLRKAYLSGKHLCYGMAGNNFIIDPLTTHKVISSTNKSHNLPLLSNNSIQLLINYYNEFGCMPESVDIETYMETEYKFGIDSSWEEIKLNQQGEIEITIPTKHSDAVCPKCGDRMKPLTKSDRCVNGQCGYEVEEKVYTESEVETLFSKYEECYVLHSEGCSIDPIEWFNTNKK